MRVCVCAVRKTRELGKLAQAGWFIGDVGLMSDEQLLNLRGG